ncbi:MAG: hypothetical protein WCN98_05360 [Verrucomicrobiaceae bacterium]
MKTAHLIVCTLLGIMPWCGRAEPPPGMTLISGGKYKPLYAKDARLAQCSRSSWTQCR